MRRITATVPKVVALALLALVVVAVGLVAWAATFDGQAQPASAQPSSGAAAAPTEDEVLLPLLGADSSPRRFVQVSAGEDHTCGLKAPGVVICWGEASLGQATPPAGSFASVSAGSSHTCGVRSDGTVACWGYKGDGRATPPAGGFTSVSAGRDHTCRVTPDGTVACWGNNVAGQTTPPAP